MRTPKNNARLSITKIINDAMKNKDRTVNIFVGPFGITVNVEPIIKEEEPHWIIKQGHEDYMTCFPYICSACGSEHSRMTPYCPDCGEKLKIPYKETEVKNG